MPRVFQAHHTALVPLGQILHRQKFSDEFYYRVKGKISLTAFQDSAGGMQRLIPFRKTFQSTALKNQTPSKTYVSVMQRKVLSY